MVDLHTFLPAGFTSSEAHGIDAAGNIVGWASGPAGTHAFLWCTDSLASVPEPSTATLMLIGLAGIAGRVVWRRRLTQKPRIRL